MTKKMTYSVLQQRLRFSVNYIVAWSVRKVRPSYNGFCMRIRRSSDGQLKDIGFVNGVIDTGEILSFCGAGDGYVETIYNQGSRGAAYNLTQPVSGRQPLISSGGEIVERNGKPSVFFNGTSYLTTPLGETILLKKPLSFLVVSSCEKPVTYINSAIYWQRLLSHLSDIKFFIGRYWDGSFSSMYGNGVDWQYSGSAYNTLRKTTYREFYNEQLISYSTQIGTSSVIYLNGLKEGEVDELEMTDVTDRLCLGGLYSSDTTQLWVGTFQESLIYESNNLEVSDIIINNSNSFYNVFYNVGKIQYNYNKTILIWAKTDAHILTLLGTTTHIKEGVLSGRDFVILDIRVGYDLDVFNNFINLNLTAESVDISIINCLNGTSESVKNIYLNSGTYNNLLAHNPDAVIDAAARFINIISAVPTWSLSFDGVDDYAETANFAALSNQWTVEAWVYPTKNHSTGSVNTQIIGREYVANNFPFALGYINALGNNNVFIGYHDGSWRTCFAASSPALNEWTHVAGVRDGSSLKIYINGVLSNSVTRTTNAPNSTSRIRLGRRWDTTVSPNNVFGGRITEARVWSVAKTIEQINESMNVRLAGDETNLVGYWPLNDGTGSTANEIVASRDATIFGAQWQESDQSFLLS